MAEVTSTVEKMKTMVVLESGNFVKKIKTVDSNLNLGVQMN